MTHVFVATDEQKKAILWLTHCASQEGMEWCGRFADHLADLYIENHRLHQEYEAGERACIKLEAAMSEIKYLRTDIKQVVDQMSDLGREGMWKEVLRLLTSVRAEREKYLPSAVEDVVNATEV